MLNGFLRQSTASQSDTVGPFVSSSDFKTPSTSLTINASDVKLSKGGAAQVNKNSGGLTHLGNGDYSITFDATDTSTVGPIKGSIVVAGALPFSFKYFVLEEAVFDMLYKAGATGASGDLSGITGQLDDIQAAIDATPTALETATAVRTELTPELTTLDHVDQTLEADTGTGVFRFTAPALTKSSTIRIISLGQVGDVSPGTTFDFKFLTMLGDLPSSLAGGPVISIFKNNVETPTLLGVTTTPDFALIPGVTHVRVNTAADATFYNTGNFQAVVTTGTVEGISAVGYVVAQFSINARSTSVSSAGIADIQSRLPAALESGKMSSTIDTGVVEGGLNWVQSMRLNNAANAGRLTKVSPTELHIASAANPGQVRINATFDDAGNRILVVLDPN